MAHLRQYVSGIGASASGPQWIGSHTIGVPQAKSLPLQLLFWLADQTNGTQRLGRRLPSSLAAAFDRLVPVGFVPKLQFSNTPIVLSVIRVHEANHGPLG